VSAVVARPLRARLLLLITMGVLLFGSLNILLVGRLVYRALAAEQEQRLAFVSRLLAQRAARPLLVGDRLGLAKLLEESRSVDPDLAYLAIVGRTGELVELAASAEVERTLLAGSDEPLKGFRETRAPILDGELGEVRVGSDEAALRAALERVVATIAWMVAAFLGVGLLAAVLVARSITRPLERMTAFASNFRLDGALPELGVGGDDEMAALARHLVDNAARLQALHHEGRERERSLARVEHLASVGTLAAGMAHEINNPLAGLRAALERLLRLARDPEQADRYGVVLRDAIARIERAIRGVLSFARVSEAEIVDVDLADALSRALELAAPKLERSRVAIVQDLSPELPAVAADRRQLDQLLLNLALNACDAMPDGGELAFTARREDPGALVLDVHDSGPGIPAELAERIFDPFFTTKAPGEGTGLGLAVSRAAAREMGGDLELVRAPGTRGAHFRLRLRTAAEAPDGSTAAR
jgi:two-component system NtrC family sensor kinase